MTPTWAIQPLNRRRLNSIVYLFTTQSSTSRSPLLKTKQVNIQQYLVVVPVSLEDCQSVPVLDFHLCALSPSSGKDSYRARSWITS